VLLSDLDLAKRLVDPDPKKRIIITPLIDPVAQIGPSSINLSLGVGFKVPVTSSVPFINPDDKTSVNTQYMRDVDVPVGEEFKFFIHPGEFVLATTLEYLRVPRDLGCRLEGRSSYGRMGLLVHVTAAFVDPGYSGRLTFELYNAGRLPILLKPGDRVAQACFHNLSGDAQIPYDQRQQSKYKGSLSVEVSRIWKEK